MTHDYYYYNECSWKNLVVVVVVLPFSYESDSRVARAAAVAADPARLVDVLILVTAPSCSMLTN